MRTLLQNDEGSPGECLCILTTTDLDSVKHGSRTPMEPFESPFLGMTDDEVRAWMKERRHPKTRIPNFAYWTFAVLDEDTVKNKTCRIGCIDIDEEAGDRILTTDFFASLYVRVPLEAGTRLWYEEVESEELEVGAGGVYNHKCIEKEWRETYERNRKKNRTGVAK